MALKAVLFDLYGTLAYVKNPISSEEISEFLLRRGYRAYPQSLDAASHYVSMIDYPKQGYDSWKAYLKQVLRRLDVEVDADTLEELATLYQKRRTLTLHEDAATALRKTKDLNLKTAIITTIAHFYFYPAIEPIHQYIDAIITGYEASCEKSNPKMHQHALTKLGVRPQEAVMVGAESLVDIKIPKSLGMKTIFLDRDNRLRYKLPEADAKVTTLTEAIDQIERWED